MGVNQSLPTLLWLAPALALFLPPFLLIPLLLRLPAAQLFKDLFEACLWVSPATGAMTLALIWRMKKARSVTLRERVVVASVALACADLISPLFFYVLLAILAGH